MPDDDDITEGIREKLREEYAAGLDGGEDSDEVDD